jgi:hypothetical protein
MEIMWRVIRFVAGAFVLFLAASPGSAQAYADHCEACDIETTSFALRIPFCFDADSGTRGNTRCQIRADVSLTGSTRVACVYTGDPCLPTQPIRTYQSYWQWQSLFGYTASMLSGGGYGCCEPDGTDWCAAWGMPSGCT